MADKTNNTGNPWKGLNFYVEGEVLYGRNKEIESLSHYIINNTQTVLYGKSGIGKSSILNAGIFPIARRQGLLPVAIRLDHGTTTSYFQQIRHAIERSGVEVKELLPPVDPEAETLWEYMHRCVFLGADGHRIQLLLVLDQFEEIFTLQQDEKRKLQFFDELAALLNNITPLYIINAGKASHHDDTTAEEVSGDLDDLDIDLELDTQEEASKPAYLEKVDYHIVFTLREDFLSYLERYTAYIPVMKANRYALLPLNEEQAADIIMLPRKGLVSQKVAELIIQKVTGRLDFHLDGIPEIDVDAAVLSLYLSRLYIKKGDNDQPITADLVSQESDDIIRDFYEECVSDLPNNVVEKIEDELITYDGRRNNVSRNDLEREGVPSEIIDRLVYDKKLLRQFNYQGDTRVEFMHDILCPVVDQRINQRELAQKQEEERLRQEAEKRAYMEEEERKRQEIEHKAARARKRNRRRLGWAVGLLAAGVISTLLYLWGLEWEHSDYYAGFTYRNGWPVGICEVSDDGDDSLVVYYRLTRHGSLPEGVMGADRGHYFRVEVLCKGGKPTTNKLIEEPLVALDETEGTDNQARNFARMQLNTAKWEFTANSNGEMANRTAFDIEGRVLYSMQFFHSAEITSDGGTTQQATTLWANYIDSEGKSLRVNDNGADRMRISTDSLGYYVSYQFFNERGIPQHNSRQAYGYAYDVTTKGVISAVTALNEYGAPLAKGYLHFIHFDQYKRWTYAQMDDLSEATAKYSDKSIVFNMPNRRDTLRYNAQGQLTYRSMTTLGLQTKRVEYTYDEEGRNTALTTYINDGLTLQQRRVYQPNTQIPTEIWEFNDSLPVKYKLEKHSIEGNTETVCHYQGNNPNTMIPCNTEGDLAYHRLTVVSESLDFIYTRKTLTYWGIGTFGQQEQQLQQEIIVQNTAGLKKQHIVFNSNGERIMSMEYDIEDGRITGQHVIGITGDTIRCPQWDENHFNYYAMTFIRDFTGQIVSVAAKNELGGESIIIAPDGSQWRMQIGTGEEMVLSETSNEGDKRLTIGYTTMYETTNRPQATSMDYIHITDTTGTAYLLGLRDGDILLNTNSSQLKVARHIKGTRKYDTLTFEARLDTLSGLSPLYKVYFNEIETGILQLLTHQ